MKLLKMKQSGAMTASKSKEAGIHYEAQNLVLSAVK
jgi:hypothetical protein